MTGLSGTCRDGTRLVTRRRVGEPLPCRAHRSDPPADDDCSGARPFHTADRNRCFPGASGDRSNWTRRRGPIGPSPRPAGDEPGRALRAPLPGVERAHLVGQSPRGARVRARLPVLPYDTGLTGAEAIAWSISVSKASRPVAKRQAAPASPGQRSGWWARAYRRQAVTRSSRAGRAVGRPSTWDAIVVSMGAPYEEGARPPPSPRTGTGPGHGARLDVCPRSDTPSPGSSSPSA